MRETDDGRKVQKRFLEGAYRSATHMCLIYQSEEERRSIIEQFIIAAFMDDDRVEYFHDEWSADDLRAALAERGIDVAAAEKTGQIRLRPAATVYHPRQLFNPEAMWQRLRHCYEDAIRGSFAGVRVSGEMTWALKGIPGSEKLIEYERGINPLIKTYPMVVICQYDAQRFDGATLMEVLRAHPFMIAQGRVVSNPYYEED